MNRVPVETFHAVWGSLGSSSRSWNRRLAGRVGLVIALTRGRDLLVTLCIIPVVSAIAWEDTPLTTHALPCFSSQASHLTRFARRLSGTSHAGRKFVIFSEASPEPCCKA